MCHVMHYVCVRAFTHTGGVAAGRPVGNRHSLRPKRGIESGLTEAGGTKGSTRGGLSRLFVLRGDESRAVCALAFLLCAERNAMLRSPEHVRSGRVRKDKWKN